MASRKNRRGKRSDQIEYKIPIQTRNIINKAVADIEEDKRHPLDLPEGSVRAIIVIMVTLFFILTIFTGQDIPPTLTHAWSGLVSYYVGTRVGS